MHSLFKVYTVTNIFNTILADILSSKRYFLTKMNFNVKGQLVSGDLKDLVSKIFYLRFSFILLHPHSGDYFVSGRFPHCDPG